MFSNACHGVVSMKQRMRHMGALSTVPIQCKSSGTATSCCGCWFLRHGRFCLPHAGAASRNPKGSSVLDTEDVYTHCPWASAAKRAISWLQQQQQQQQQQRQRQRQRSTKASKQRAELQTSSLRTYAGI